MKITLHEQECIGNYQFDGQIFYTKGMESKFRENIFLLIFYTMGKIRKLVKDNIADYFQVATVECEGIKTRFYIIDDIDHITFLLPEEY